MPKLQCTDIATNFLSFDLFSCRRKHILNLSKVVIVIEAKLLVLFFRNLKLVDVAGLTALGRGISGYSIAWKHLSLERSNAVHISGSSKGIFYRLRFPLKL